MVQSRFEWPDDDPDFRAYHEANPEVYAKLREFALQAKASGRRHFGINMLHERLRWYTLVEAKRDTFKVNNNYRPFYARLLMKQEPELAGFFELRRAPTADRIVQEIVP